MLSVTSFTARHFGRFDVILCRNVLMYLSENKRTHILDAIAPSMEERGS
jgi:chemotaxis methyl-accepting protein methylase